MTTVANTVTEDLEINLVELLSTWLTANLSWAGQVAVVRGQAAELKTLGMLAIYCTACTEHLYQTGIYKITLKCSSMVSIDDAGAGAQEQLRELHSVVLDFWQQSNVVAVINALESQQVHGTVLGPQGLDILGDRYWQRDIEVDVFANGGTP